MNLRKKVAALAVFVMSAPVMAAGGGSGITVPSAVDQITAIKDSLAGYGPIIWVIGLTVAGIMVGLKWIRRGKSAA